MTRATGSFEVKLTPQEPDAPEDVTVLGRMTIDKTFHGDLEGTSRGAMLAHMTAVKGSAGYVAIERVTGTLGGRTGSFHLQHNGVMTRGNGALTVSVIPDSGTDGLAGISGTLDIRIEAGGKHYYDFDYTIGDV